MDEGEWCAHADPAAKTIAQRTKAQENLRLKECLLSRFSPKCITAVLTVNSAPPEAPPLRNSLEEVQVDMQAGQR